MCFDADEGDVFGHEKSSKLKNQSSNKELEHTYEVCCVRIEGLFYLCLCFCKVFCGEVWIGVWCRLTYLFIILYYMKYNIFV